jgi:hypothetical protein
MTRKRLSAFILAGILLRKCKASISRFETMPKILFISMAVALLTLILVLTTSAGVIGSLDPPGPPGSTSSHTLSDIYNRLNYGTMAIQSTFAEPANGPGTSTGHTLNEVMSVAPEVDDVNGATEADVLSGKTFWGVTTGDWGVQPGTMPNNGAGSTIVPTTTNQSVAAGYWASANTVQGDSDLVAANIVSGTAIFGVDVGR